MSGRRVSRSDGRPAGTSLNAGAVAPAVVAIRASGSVCPTSKVSAFTLQLGTADLDGDGDADFTIPDAIAVTLPIEDAGPYLEWFRTSSGSPDGLPGLGSSEAKMLEIEYQDGDGIPVLTVSVRVTIESLGFSDMFLGTSPTPGREIQATLKAKGIIVTKGGGGTGTTPK